MVSSRDFKNMVLPRRHIQVQAARLQVVSVALVPGIAEHIFESPLSVIEVGEREPDVALAGVSGIIYGDDQAFAVRPLPRAGDEGV